MNSYKRLGFPLIYIFLILLFSAYMYLKTPAVDASLLVTVIALLLLLGAVILYFSYDIETENFYAIIFIILICFGLFNVVLTPVVDVCDESEHFWRSEITSQGVLVPDYVDIPGSNQSGYKTIASLKTLYPNTGKTVFETAWDDEAINYTPIYTSSAFSQNPFYGYVAQALGILLAKSLDLNNIWMLWLGRLFNLILYAGICTYAIKKAPIFKMPLFVVACLPLALYQAASMSIDSFVNASSLLTVAYFLYLYSSDDYSLTYKNVIIFFVLAIIGGLTKVTYLALAFLIFLVPQIKFESRNDYLVSRYGILAVIGVTLLWTMGYATPVLKNSWRGDYFINYHVDAKDQIMYMIHYPKHTLSIISQLPNTFYTVIEGYFSFANLPPHNSGLLAWCYAAFFAFVSLFYPKDVDIDKKTRGGVLAVFLIIYFGIVGVQYLTWCSVGQAHITGIFGRYFIPLLSLVPIFLTLNSKKRFDDLNILIVAVALSFLANSIIFNLFSCYF